MLAVFRYYEIIILFNIDYQFHIVEHQSRHQEPAMVIRFASSAERRRWFRLLNLESGAPARRQRIGGNTATRAASPRP